MAFRGLMLGASAPSAFARPAHAELTGGAVVGAVSAPSAVLLDRRTNPALPESSTIADRESDDFLHRYPPRARLWELGGYLGPVFISDKNSFRDLVFVGSSDAANIRTFSTFRQPAIEFGLRGSYFPLSFLGAELEGLLISGETDSGEVATVLGARTQVVVQSPIWSVVPFVLGGFGFWNVRNSASGNDVDPAFHYGGGVKLNLTHDLAVRIDLRDTITNYRGHESYPHSVEILAGASLVLGRETAPEDTERQMIPSANCPKEVPVAPPASAVDTDSDGIADRDDPCPVEPGAAPSGCPDSDADGFPDHTDGCPAIAGVAPDGCAADADADGILRADDRCPDRPENRNGFEDSDGCPDELPVTVQKFVGVLAGIEFDRDQPAIRPSSAPILAKAAAMLAEYPSLNVEIIGYTDSRGSRAHNIDLSQRRADAVKANLVARGIATARLRARGEGPDDPIATNDTRQGRQQNRRIEFRIIE